MQNKITRILKEQSGASFMFVLGVMMLLMAIGVSTLAAASANAGFAIRQKEHSQIMLLEDSIHNNILYSLQKDPSDEDLLSAQLVMAIYEAASDSDKMARLTNKDGIDLEMDIDGAGSGWNDGNIKMESITLYFPEDKQNVIIRDAIDTIIPREPKTATVNAAMIVTVIINAKDQMITSRAFYEYTDGVLSDEEEAGEMQFAIDGKWRLIKHENVDTKD